MEKNSRRLVFLVFVTIPSIWSSDPSVRETSSHEEQAVLSASECPIVESFPRSNEHDVSRGSFFGNGEFGPDWEDIVEKRQAWIDADWTNPADFQNDDFMFFVHSLRTKNRKWNFRGTAIESRDEEHASHRREIIDDPETSMSKRLLSLSLIDQDHPLIFGACAGWILRIDPTAIFATANTDMSLVNAYGKDVLQFAESLQCWEAMCGQNGKSICDNLRLHLLSMYRKYGIRTPRELLEETDIEDGLFPYNEIAALGKSPDTMEIPQIIGVIFGDDSVLYPSHAEDCEALREELKLKAQERGIPVIRLTQRRKPTPRSVAAEYDQDQTHHDKELERLRKNLEKLKPLLETSPAAQRASEAIEAKIRALKGGGISSPVLQ